MEKKYPDLNILVKENKDFSFGGAIFLGFIYQNYNGCNPAPLLLKIACEANWW